MFCLMFQFDVRPEQCEAFRALVLQHAEESLRDEPGTLYHTVQDDDHENRFYVFEAYVDRAAHETHVNGPILERNWALAEPMVAAVVSLGRGHDSASTSTE